MRYLFTLILVSFVITETAFADRPYSESGKKHPDLAGIYIFDHPDEGELTYTFKTDGTGDYVSEKHGTIYEFAWRVSMYQGIIHEHTYKEIEHPCANVVMDLINGYKLPFGVKDDVIKICWKDDLAFNNNVYKKKEDIE